MREIKFRGFGISDKRWHYGFLTIYESGKCIIGGFEVYTDSIGQFTGIKDKNGKEIYEGGIVMFDKWGNRTKGIVVWQNNFSRFAIKHKDEDNDDYFTDVSHYSNIEVIGNIHENPELLKEG